MITNKEASKCPCNNCVDETEDCGSKCIKYFSWAITRKPDVKTDRKKKDHRKAKRR